MGRNKGSNLAFENAEAIAKNPAFKDVGVKAVKDMSVEERKRAYAMYYDKLKGSKNPNDVIKAKTDRDKYISMLGNRHAERESLKIEKEIREAEKKGIEGVLNEYARNEGFNSRVRGFVQTGRIMGANEESMDYDPVTLALERLSKDKKFADRIERARGYGKKGFGLIEKIPYVGSAIEKASDYGETYDKGVNYSGKDADIKKIKNDAKNKILVSVLTDQLISKGSKSVSKALGDRPKDTIKEIDKKLVKKYPELGNEDFYKAVRKMFMKKAKSYANTKAKEKIAPKYFKE